MVLHSYAPEWSYEETKQKIFGVEDRATRDFAAVAYVLGGRLNEVTNLRPKDIGEVINSEGNKILLVNLLTLKNRNVERRLIPVNVNAEKEYANILISLTKNFTSDCRPFHVEDGGLCQRTWQRRIRVMLDIHPHALRHLRVHHIDDKEVPKMKGLTPRQFKDLFGWALIETSAHYQSRTRGKDLSELF